MRCKLFDSLGVVALSPHDYETYVRPYTQRIFSPRSPPRGLPSSTFFPGHRRRST